MSRYDLSRVADELDTTAEGISYYGNALYVAQDFDFLNDFDRAILRRWLNGSQTKADCFSLFHIATKIREKGKQS